MNTGALLKIVKATRLSMRLADKTRELMGNDRSETQADEIAGFLKDALFILCGDTLAPWQDFERDSRTMHLLKSDFSDEAITDVFAHLQELPPPYIVNREEREELYRKNGGYMHREIDMRQEAYSP